eukprot:356443-Chlamydomonas_euryale.AAC.2
MGEGGENARGGGGRGYSAAQRTAINAQVARCLCVGSQVEEGLAPRPPRPSRITFPLGRWIAATSRDR